MSRKWGMHDLWRRSTVASFSQGNPKGDGGDDAKGCHSHTLASAMSEVAAARPKTSGKKSTPSELEDWARKKSPVGSPKAAPRSPPAAAAAAEAPGGAALPAMKQGLPEESPKAMARMMASGRGATGTTRWRCRVPTYTSSRTIPRTEWRGVGCLRGI